MKTGIMQPYFFPYIGYWQLLNHVDTYVVFDDVNYINRGWINRNRILINGKPAYLTVSLEGASQNKLINGINVIKDRQLYDGYLNKIRLAYSHAPYFEKIYELLEKTFEYEESNLALFNINSIRMVCDYLGINTTIVISSELEKNNDLKGQEKILDICRILGGNEYINAIGGIELYNRELFFSKGITLGFLKTGDITYKQFDGEFQKDLSIIDVMMFCDVEEIRDMLDRFTII